MSVPTDGPAADPDLTVAILRAGRPEVCREALLVLEAVGVAAIVSWDGESHVLAVAPGDAARAVAQLDRYARENRPLPKPPAVRLYRGAIPSALVYVLGLFVIAVAASRSALGVDWYASGTLDAARVRGGEIWRAVTALTLHADLAHYAGNAGFGALFGGLAARLYGPGVGWLLVVLAATTANLLNALWMPAGWQSLGASTAVFAALGASAVFRWPADARRLRLAWPGGGVTAAVVLLTLLGTGDIHTDIAAHALGFGCGVLGALPLRRVTAPLGTRLQQAAAGAAVGLVACAWGAALLSAGS